MRTPDIHERIATAEDEIKGLESMIDARTRKLWAEIQKLQAEVLELRNKDNAKEPQT